jgi:hypothetical protein
MKSVRCLLDSNLKNKKFEQKKTDKNKCIKFQNVDSY